MNVKKRIQRKEAMKKGLWLSSYEKKEKLTGNQRDDLWKKACPNDMSIFKPVVAQDSSKQVAALDTGVMTTAYKNSCNFNDEIFDYYANKGFIGYQSCAMLQNDWLIAKACRVPPTDALAPDYSLLVGKEETEYDDKLAKEIKQAKILAEKKYDLKKTCRTHLTNNRVFGVSYALPIVDGINYEAPFNIDGVKEGSYKGIKIIDPVWMKPEFDIYSLAEPASLDFYEPTYYRVLDNKRIHKSHFLKIVFSQVTDVLKPSYFFGGVSLSQMLYENSFYAQTISKEIVDLVKSKRLLIVDGNLEDYIAQEGEFQTIIDAFSDMRDNEGLLFKNVDEDIKQIDTSLSDIPETMTGQYQICASIAEMTYEKLMGTSPKGMNASGEFSNKDYTQTLQAIQDLQAKPLYERHYQLSLKSDFGRSLEFDIEFDPIDSPTSKEVAEVDAIKTNTLSTLASIGAITPQEVRIISRKDKSLGISNLPLENEEDDFPDDEFENDVKKDGEKFRMRNPAISPDLQQKEKLKIKANDTMDGGAGSGDHNHKGRKGKVGGSASAEKENRTTSSSGEGSDPNFIVVSRTATNLTMKSKKDNVEFLVDKHEWDDDKKKLTASGVGKYKKAKEKVDK